MYLKSGGHGPLVYMQTLVSAGVVDGDLVPGGGGGTRFEGVPYHRDSGTHRDEGRPFTRYIGTLYTIRVRMTVV